MAYTEYPNNSMNAKATTTQTEVPKPKLQGVAKAQKRPKTFWRKTADEFFGNNPDDGKTIGEHIWFDAFIPFVKNGIVETITRILFGDSYIPRSNGGAFNSIVDRRGAAQRIGYSSISTGKAPQNQVQERMAYDYEELEFSSRGDADSVLERMFELIDSPYGRVTVGDLYDISEVSPGPYTNCNYGWTNLNGARVIRNYNNTFSLSLPRPKPLK